MTSYLWMGEWASSAFSPPHPGLAPIYLFISLWHFGVCIVCVPDSVALGWRFFGILDLKFLYMCFKTGIWVEGVSAWALGYSGSFYIATVAGWEVSEGESERVRDWGWGDA